MTVEPADDWFEDEMYRITCEVMNEQLLEKEKNIMKTIQLTDEQYKVLQDMLLEQGFKLCEETKVEIEKWQPKKGSYFVALTGHIHPSRVVDEEMLNFGQYYPTKEAAENARDAMRAHNRLLSWLAENDDGWVADWGSNNKGKYYIYSEANPKRDSYSVAADWNYKDLVKVYMSKENAEKLCKLLNEGIVEL